ncbi:MAG: hypothetical protein Q7S28_00885 [bacterium]|nr:hypothetical protein [bacterium]
MLEYLLRGVATYNPGSGQQHMPVEEQFFAIDDETAKKKMAVRMEEFKRLPSANIRVRLIKFTQSVVMEFAESVPALAKKRSK